MPQPETLKILNLLSICRKAGKLSWGFDAAKDAILSQNAACILITGDVSEKTSKEIRYFASAHSSNVPVWQLPCSMEQASRGLGLGENKKAGIWAVLDAGFTKKIKVLLADADTAPLEQGGGN